MRPITVEITFTWELRVNGSHIADIDCRATAPVFGDWEVGHKTEIEVWTGEKYIPAGWLEPHIGAYLVDGAEDDRFIEAARNAGGEADYRRELMA